MKKVMTIFGPILSVSLIVMSCNSSSNELKEATKTVDSSQSALDTIKVNEKNVTESKESTLDTLEERIKQFLISTENTYGWETQSNDISLDFFPDGRLHIQGPDGESTMWEGKWNLKGDKIIMVRPDLEKTISVTAKISGENLVLDNIIYNRYKP
jgi:hypothetical protein